MSDEARVLRSRLRRFRLRAVLAGFLDVLPSCVALSFAALVAFAFLFENGALSLRIVAAGPLAALLITLVRAPSLVDTARSVDRRAGLEQRLETAVELMEDSDPVAALILRDARCATDELRGEHAIPFRLGGGRATRAAFAVLTLVLLVAAFWRRAEPERALRLVPARGLPENAELRDAEIDSNAGGYENASATAPEEALRAESPPESTQAQPASSDPRESFASAEAREERTGASDSPGDAAAEWIAIESPLERASGAGGLGSGPVESEGAGRAQGEAEGAGAGEARGEPVSELSSQLRYRPGGDEESPSSGERIPRELSESLREYFAKVRGKR